MADGMDSIMLLMDDLDEYLGPDAQQMMIKAFQQEELKATHLTELQERCRKEGHFIILPMVEQSRRACAESCSLILPLRQTVRNITDGLLELREPGVLQNEVAVKEIVEEIKEATQSAFHAAQSSTKKIDELGQKLSQVDAEWVQQAQQAAQDAKESDEQSIELRRNAFAFSCLEGVGAAGSAVGGLGGAAMVCMAASPPGLVAAGTVTLGCAVLTCLVDWNRRCKDADAREAEGKAAKARELEKDSKAQGSSTSELKQATNFHEKMWKGIEMSSRQADDASSAMGKVDPNGPRRSAFHKRLDQTCTSLTQFVASIDKYLFFLSRTEFMPPTINVRAIVGSETYKRLQQEARKALGAQAALESEGTQGAA